MNVVKLDMFCPLCGVEAVYVDEHEAGDYYAGTTNYCMACHASLPDIRSARSLLASSPEVVDHYEVGRYLRVREAAGLPSESDAETVKVREAFATARANYTRRTGSPAWDGKS